MVAQLLARVSVHNYALPPREVHPQMGQRFKRVVVDQIGLAQQDVLLGVFRVAVARADGEAVEKHFRPSHIVVERAVGVERGSECRVEVVGEQRRQAFPRWVKRP